MNLTAQIIAVSQTKSDALRRVRGLHELVASKVFNSKSDNEFLTSADKQWIDSLGETFFNSFTEKNVDTTFSSCEQELKSIEPIIIYLPSTIGDEQLQKISAKVRQMTDKNALLELKHDPSLIAGCAISYKGKYQDYSIKNKLAQSIENLHELATNFP